MGRKIFYAIGRFLAVAVGLGIGGFIGGVVSTLMEILLALLGVALPWIASTLLFGAFWIAGMWFGGHGLDRVWKRKYRPQEVAG